MFQRTVLRHLNARAHEDIRFPGIHFFIIPTPRWEAYALGSFFGSPTLVLSQGILATLSQEELAELAKAAIARGQQKGYPQLTALAAMGLWVRKFLPAQIEVGLFEGRRLDGSFGLGKGLWALAVLPYVRSLEWIRRKIPASTTFELLPESFRLERALGAHSCQEVAGLSLLSIEHAEARFEFFRKEDT